MNICPAIQQLKPYQGGKPISELKRELGLGHVVKLASNESPLATNPKVTRAITQAISAVGRYPDSNGFELKQAISAHLSLTPEHITLGNGSNDILELAARCFVCKADDEVIFSQFAFVVYPLTAQALGATSVVVAAKDFGHDLEAMLGAISANTKLIFIANPNNPTGTLLNDEAIYAFLLAVPNSVIVVLDQAYFEYLNVTDNAVQWLAEFENLIITRTFSKAYGLAGLRVGYGLSNSKIADYLNRIRQPFNVNHIAQTAAIVALQDKDFLYKAITLNKKGILQLSKGFDELGLCYIPSSANFVAVKVHDAATIYQKLLEKGFIVRLVEMDNYLRVSVGTIRENHDFLQTLQKLI